MTVTEGRKQRYLVFTNVSVICGVCLRGIASLILRSEAFRALVEFFSLLILKLSHLDRLHTFSILARPILTQQHKCYQEKISEIRERERERSKEFSRLILLRLSFSLSLSLSLSQPLFVKHDFYLLLSFLTLLLSRFFTIVTGFQETFVRKLRLFKIHLSSFSMSLSLCVFSMVFVHRFVNRFMHSSNFTIKTQQVFLSLSSSLSFLKCL